MTTSTGAATSDLATTVPPALIPPPAAGCPRCAAPMGATQDWCVACGAAARTALVPSPNWRLPAIVLATLATLAVLALIAAFVIATNDDEPLVRTAPSAPVVPPGS